MTYQELFNQTLTKMRYATSAALIDNQPLMRTLVKIMFDFSDGLQENNLLKETRKQEKELKDDYKQRKISV